MGLLDIVRPNLQVNNLREIPLSILKEQGIVYLLFDLDNTIVPYNDPNIPADIIAWFQEIKAAGFFPCLVSNNHGPRVEDAAGKLGIPFICDAKKPWGDGFRRAIAMLGAEKEQTAIVGDQLLTDMAGGNKDRFFTILVEPMKSKEYWFTTHFSRRVEKILKKFL
ncbi:MAG: YqeG family HAD IIIA-type phosphatase [Peptococcaceae bacterium]|nr:YqeG family HAD IIIA-type phosphatase [Peptococcaceae bacterium]